MASVAPPARRSLLDRLLPDRLLGALAWVLLAVAIVAVVRGRHEWAQVPRAVWFHLATIAVVLVLTPVMLTRRKGDRRHRQLGWIWAGAMWATALFSLTIAPPRGMLFSPIVLLSLFVLYAVPRLILQARAHDVVAHRGTVRGLVIGGLLIAGFFTFPFNRLLGHWLFG
ncbi:MAG TPA: hypothetical protein PK808_04520 [Polymorphobacter sp.]|nr:hypothetical protein [Polymorphobacter sp.]